jgi:mannose-6-phosphate isomerase
MEDDKKKLYPFKFIPIAEKVSWGGNVLVKNYNKKFFEPGLDGTDVALTAEDTVGESWELADMGFRDSLVDNGWLGGNSISDLMETYMERVVGDNVFEYYGRQFPLLIKVLDVRGKTPLMVSPDDEVAEQRYDALGKVKFWYIEDAEPGSKVYMGFKKDISAQEFYERCHDGNIEELMNVIYPKKGDSFMIVPGLVHGAADGLVIAEVAEASDLDFKLFNWGKPTENDSVEELSIEAAFDFLILSRYDESLFTKGRLWPHEEEHDHEGHEHHHHEVKIADKLAQCPQFTVTKISLTDPLHIYAEKFNSFLIYLCLEGEASIQVPAEKENGEKFMDNYVISAGDTLLVPNDISDFFLVPRDRSTILLESMIEKRDDVDPYINPNAQPYLPGEEEDFEDPADADHCDDDHCDDDHCDGHCEGHHHHHD